MKLKLKVYSQIYEIIQLSQKTITQNYNFHMQNES